MHNIRQKYPLRDSKQYANGSKQILLLNYYNKCIFTVEFILLKIKSKASKCAFIVETLCVCTLSFNAILIVQTFYGI